MTKLIPHLVKPLFALFCVAVAAGVMYFSFQALGLIFPDDLASQLFGMINFDIAALIWFFVFVSHCRSTMQYVWSAFGFIVGIVGTLGLVGLEVGISTGMVVVEDVARPLTYIFVGAVVGHLVLSYAFHASGPETASDISLGIEKAKIVDEAQKAVERNIQDKLPQLADAIGDDLFKSVMRDLRLDVRVSAKNEPPRFAVLDAPKEEAAAAVLNFLSFLPPWLGGDGKKWNRNAASVEDHLQAVIPTPEPAPLDAGSEEAEEGKPKK